MRPSTVLLLVAGWLVILGPVARAGDRTLDPKKAAEAIRKAGGYFAVDLNAPGQPVVGVFFSPNVKSDFGDKDLELLVAFPTLTILDLCKTKVTNRGLSTLQRLAGLRALGLRGTRVTDKSLRALKRMTSLRNLDLRNTKVTEAGVKDLKKTLPKLKVMKGPR